MSVKATGDDTGDAFSLLEADEPPGFGPPLPVPEFDVGARLGRLRLPSLRDRLLILASANLLRG